MTRLRIAQYIALGATVLSIIGVLLGGLSGDQPGSVFMQIACIVGLGSYIFGGFLTAVKMSGKIAKWGWFIAPFPFDIITGIMSFVVALIVFVFLPIIPIRKAYKESMRY